MDLTLNTLELMLKISAEQDAANPLTSNALRVAIGTTQQILDGMNDQDLRELAQEIEKRRDWATHLIVTHARAVILNGIRRAMAAHQMLRTAHEIQKRASVGLPDPREIPDHSDPEAEKPY